MRSPSTVLAGSALALGLSLALTGCARAPSGAPAAAPVTVTVSYPVERGVTDSADFTARTAAVNFRPSSSVLSISCGWSASCIWSC
jgi:hypothetical protein